MSYFDYAKEKDFLICIDSDGCAMDTMNSKHFNSFGPEYVKTYGLEEYKEEALNHWNEVNLFSGTRGINRFKGLAMALREMSNRKGIKFEGLEGFEHWCETAPQLSNPALLEECQKQRNECMEKALLWSIHVNLSIVEAQDDDMPFENVKDAMDEMSKQADLTAVSSANGQAVDHEWTKHQIKENCRVLLCQEAGSKAYCIERLLEKGYDKDKVLMVGDAPGDKKAALDNGVRFYPIIVEKEGFSWKRLKEEASVKLLNGEFDDNYQAQLIEEFEAALGI